MVLKAAEGEGKKMLRVGEGECEGWRRQKKGGMAIDEGRQQ